MFINIVSYVYFSVRGNKERLKITGGTFWFDFGGLTGTDEETAK